MAVNVSYQKAKYLVKIMMFRKAKPIGLPHGFLLKKKHNTVQKKLNGLITKKTPVQVYKVCEKIMSTQEIKLTVVDDKVKVVTPYNKEFVNKARNLRGNWKDGAWWFDDSIIEYVSDVMNEIFGTTGEIPFENCTLLVKNFSDFGNRTSVVLFGRTIARAFGRDSGAKLGDGIIFIDGKYNSGGSVKNWGTVVDNATFEIHNFPLPMTEREDVQEAIKAGWCEIKLSKKKRKREEIEAEILQLKEKISLLESELKEVE